MKSKLKIFLLALTALALGAFAWVWFAPCGMGGCAPVSDLDRFQAEGSQLLDMNGKTFGTLATVNRRVVPVDSLPPYLPKAFLAVEDRRFYEHKGVDWKRFLGALASNVKAGGVAQGGSTITMQLARNLFPDRLPYQERSIRRKLLEVRIARQIEKAYGKPKILELYLNHVYLGQGAYGVDAAAREYFGKPASRLTLAEAALLGGLPQAPSRINPRENMRAALTRRNLVLREMGKAGYAPQADVDAAIATPIRLSRAPSAGSQKNAWFVERVRRELEERVGERIYTAGLKVHTTLDPVAQLASEQELARQLAAVESGGFGAYQHPTKASGDADGDSTGTGYLQGIAMVLDARTGEVRSLVGGRDYEDSKFDRAFQALRQPGSAFKPFVYLTALQRGIPPTEKMDDAPLTITLAGGEKWTPKNYTPQYLGPITLREALTQSKNTVTARLAQQVGMDQVAQTAHTLGITTPVATTPAASLGASEVRPAELIASYAAFANGGNRVTAHVVRRIEDRDGGVVWDGDTEESSAIEPAAAYVLTTMLRDVVDRGTAATVRAAGFRGAAAGKTGTTNSATDVWFVGYTPELVGGIWMGFDRPQTIVRGASGGTIAAPVWARIMSRIYATRPMPREWAMPGGVVTAQIDRGTGAPVDAGCPARGPVYTEYFVGSAPPSVGCPGAGMYAGYPTDTAWHDMESGLEGVYIPPPLPPLPSSPGDTFSVPDLR
ncbi:MAG TPA: PBP1A family penicillin-binding protein, partial [Longimicrobiaceae bacterium]|nr:PBP1A family penicillin-binding protein [Longimicrobiaceae bacterium]